jgi:sugar lactone lactonase YvrE
MRSTCRATLVRASGLVVTLLIAGCGPAAPSSQPSGTAQATVAAATATASATASPTASTTASPPAVALVPNLPVRGRDAPLMGPVGLAFDRAGNLYVSECMWTYARIVRIDPRGMMTPFAGTGDPGYTGDGGPATSAELYCPVGMAFGPDGALFVADHANNRIRRIDTSGVISTVAGSGPTGVNMGSFSGDGGPATKAALQEPWSVAFDRHGNLYIGDRDNYRVRKIDPKGIITTVAGMGTSGFSGDGGPAIAAQMCPLGVTIDPTDNLLIADPCNNRIRRVDSHGRISTIIGTGTSGSSGDGKPATAATLAEPGQFAFDANGNLFVQEGTRVRRIDRHGVISTVFGSGKAGVPDEGTNAIQAPLPELYGLAVDADGDLYLADGNTTVYRVDTRGTLTLFAGKR